MVVVMNLLGGCSSNLTKEKELERLDKECSESLTSRRFGQADSLANMMERLALESNSEQYLRKSYYYQGDYRDDMNPTELRHREERLLMADRMATEANDTLLLIKICNLRGIWEMERQNYQTAQFLLKRGLALAKTKGDMNAVNVLESNFSEVSRMLDDTLGLQYDVEIFKKAMESGNYLRQRTAAFHCARYYLHAGADTAELRKYIDVLAINDTTSRLVPMLYARYWLENGDYNKAYHYIIQSKYDKFYEAGIIYAEVLNKLGRYQESNEYVDALFDMYNTNRYDNQWIGINRLAASNYKGLGNTEKAYEYERLYSIHSDSLYVQKLNDLTKRYTIEYGAEKLEFDLQTQREHVRWLLLLVGCLVLIVAIIIIGVTLYIRKRNKFYRSIVSQYLLQDSGKGILAKSVEIDNEPEQASASEELKNEGGAGISSSKLDELWKRIQLEMDENKIWKDTNLSRDSFAELLGCSHTYLTEAIRRMTGMAFSGFVNSYRLQEAKRMLTDISSPEVPLKTIAAESGFSSLSNFYTLFKKDTGMPPAVFRKTAKSLSESERE